MTEARKRARALFDEAAEKPLPQRAAFLDEACGDDSEMRRQVETLLVALDEATAFLDADAQTAMGSMDSMVPGTPHVRLTPGDRVGNYVIREQIGEGGFALVYAAEQQKPVARKVALKIIKLGMDTRQVIARFEAERQALAMMDHSNVAKVFDAGVTDTGRPYFVMEHVPGTPITEYADRQRLAIPQRLELFGQVCEAVQHAHQKGIIHRDIKPSNVLVAIGEGKPMVKVIDFGVAKALTQRLTEQTIYTEQGQLIGTPEYMSPEQAEMTQDNVDTRTDIYSLGVMLYELLTGTLPFDPTTLRQAGFAEIQRIIREEEPRKPSTRLSGLGEDESGLVARRRQASRTAILHQIRGDLDWIVMKALEKNRTRRYDTASEFAADVLRHLKNEPVLAGPPSTIYKVKKYVRRNRTLVGGLSGVFVVLVAGIIGTGTARAREADQRTEAEKQAAIARAVSDFLIGTLETPDPALRGPSVTVAQVLIAGGPAIDDLFADAPEIRIALHATYGKVLRALNIHDLAEQHYRDALSIARLILPSDDPTVAGILLGLGAVLIDRGRDEEAGRCFSQALAILGTSANADLDLMAEAELSRAIDLHNLGDYELAELRFRKGLFLNGKQGAPNEQTARGMDMLGRLLIDAGDLAEADQLVRDALALKRELFGQEHRQVAFSLLTLGYLERALGNFDEAVRAFQASYDMYARVQEDASTPVVIMARMELAALLEDIDEPAPMWHPDELHDLKWVAAVSYRNRGRLLYRRGRVALGDDHLRESIRIDQEIGGPQRVPSEAQTRRIWAELLLANGRPAEAEQQYRTALRLQRRQLNGADRMAMVPTLIGLGTTLIAQNATPDAEPLLAEALDLRRAHLPKDSWPLAMAEASLGKCLVELGRYEGADRHLTHALDVLEKSFGTAHWRSQDARRGLVDLYEGWQKPSMAERFLQGLDPEQGALSNHEP